MPRRRSRRRRLCWRGEWEDKEEGLATEFGNGKISEDMVNAVSQHSPSPTGRSLHPLHGRPDLSSDLRYGVGRLQTGAVGNKVEEVAAMGPAASYRVLSPSWRVCLQAFRVRRLVTLAITGAVPKAERP